ncbi:MAG: DUF4215 domain-containing protein, partial [Deltaproteobacteria bacterium]
LDDDICSGGPNNGGVCLNGDSDCPALVCPAVGFCSGGDDDGDECTDYADCTDTHCGDGHLCIGGDNDGDECTDDADCTATYCADNPAYGLCIGGDNDEVECTRDDDCPGGACGGADCTDLDAGTCVDIEECDDGNWLNADGASDVCDSNCTLPACGNGVWSVDGAAGQDEACDDGNTADGDYCSANCTVISGWCGDGVVQSNEQCDDGNTTAGDGCTASCALPVCGDGDLNVATEECDDADLNDGDGCDSNCTRTGCGNGVTAGDEECDDGGFCVGGGDHGAACNNSYATGLGCSSICNAGLTPGVACEEDIDCDAFDDGDEQGTCDIGRCEPVSGDGCNDECESECGDNELTPNEECDDGNLVDGDGCSATCTTE